MTPPLPRIVRWLIACAVPARSRAQILRELADDYHVVRHGRAAWMWLAQESASLVVAYGVQRLQRLGRSGPMWTRDVSLVLRSLRRGPLAAVGAAAMLAIGLTAAMTTVGLTDALLFRPVSQKHGDALRRIAINEHGRTTLRLSFPEWQIIRDHLDGAGLVGGVNLQPAVIRVGRDSIQTMVEVVAGHYAALTSEMLIGRTFLTVDDRPGAPATTVISSPFWARHYSASPDALGRVLSINGQPFTIVGVADALGSSSFLGASVDAWVTTSHGDALLNPGWRDDHEQRWFSAVVLPMTTRAEIDARLSAAATSLRERRATDWRDRRLVTTDGSVIVGTQRANVVALAAILGGLSAIILATAAVTLSGLLLSRAAAARRQIAVHLSIGAGQSAIARRQLLEGTLLGIAAAALAVGVYGWAAAQLREISLLPTLALRLELPAALALAPWALAAGALAGLLLAIAPTMWLMRIDLADTLRDAEVRASGGRGWSRLRRALVAAQVSFTIVLIVAAALFSRSLAAMTHADLGFERAGLIAFDFDLEPALTERDDAARLAQELLARTLATPGVSAAAMSNRAPIDTSTPVINVRRSPGESALTEVSMYLATADYFRTVGVPLLRGRAFSTSETLSMSDVVIVNEALARALWQEDDVVGRALYVGDDPVRLRVIGVARNSKYRSITESERPHLYRPTRPTLQQTIIVRTSGDPRALLRALQATFDTVGPGIIGFFPRTLDDHLAVQLLPTRAASTAAGILGLLALLLSGLALYGLVAWFVELRQREIGIRMALGASRRHVRTLIIRQTLSTIAPGLVIGVASAAAVGTVIRGLLFGVEPLSLATMSGAVTAVIAVVLVAAYGPTRRATRVDPAITLRA